MAEPVQQPVERHVELLVRRADSGRGVELSYELHSDDPHLGLFRRDFGSVRLSEEPAETFQSILDDVSKQPRRNDDERRAAAKRLEAKGAWLFTELLPEALREELWALAPTGDERPAILEIVTDDASIPWELFRLFGRAGAPYASGPFFAEAFVVTRWIAGARQVPSLPLSRIGLIVAGDSGLPSAEEEKQDVLRRAGDGRRVEEVPARYEEVMAALGSGDYDGWHFVGHGSSRGARADLWQIELRPGETLEPPELSGDAKGLGRRSPLVFLNACETARSGLCLTGIGGWASRFLEAGAGAFIGPLWAVRDSRATAFATAFYDAFLSGAPIGEAVRRARLGLRNRFPDDPTWLAYVVYARPQAACGPAAQVSAPSSTDPEIAAWPPGVPPPPLRTSPSSMFGRLWIQQKRLHQRAGTAASGPARAVRFGGGAPVPPAVEAPSRPGAESEGRPPSPRPGDRRLHEPDGSLLLHVPGGDYTLGADDINDWTRPVHRVHLGPFWIARHPVTNEQYARFLAAHADHAPPEFWQDERFNGPQQPVVGVSCDDAESYCRWAGLALPSEAQWEAAARGPEGLAYPWGDEMPEPRHANFGGRLGATSAVDAHPDGRGPFGTLDQAGNVWEWCADSWSLTAYRQRGDGAWNPVSRGETSMRVLRGGSWVNPGRDLRAAYRDRATARLRFNTQGFRCVLVEPY